eukprot:m.124844 g.124844  ORF g.124844 m.124844 type:complete len:328 (+) comp13518_c0_seq2:229-1212(+)
MERVRLAARRVRVPTAADAVHSIECRVGSDTRNSPGGIAVNLETFHGYGEAAVEADYAQCGFPLYLLQKWRPFPPAAEIGEAGAAEAGGDDAEGAAADAAPEAAPEAMPPERDRSVDDVVKECWLMVMPERTLIPLPCSELPLNLSQACDAVLGHDGTRYWEEVAEYDPLVRYESRYAQYLVQLPSNGMSHGDPTRWRCDETGVTCNLWLNLSTGFIGSGRRFFDGTGGNGAAERHFHATGRRYPLVVKLGTITKHGADVFSYALDEDDMVEDPLLETHLLHWGIDMKNLEKSEATMEEIQAEFNSSVNFPALDGPAFAPDNDHDRR